MKTVHHHERRRWFILAIVIICVLAAALLAVTRLILPDLIGQTVRQAARSHLTQRVVAQWTFEKVSIQLLPRPAVVLKNNSLVLQQSAQVAIDEIVFAPSILELLKGRVQPVFAALRRIDGHVVLPGGQRSAQPENRLADGLAAWPALVNRVRQAAPGLQVQLEKAALTIDRGADASLRISDLSAVAALDRMHLRLSCRSNVWQHLEADWRLNNGNDGPGVTRDIASRLEVRVASLDVVPLLQWLPALGRAYLVDGRIDLDLELTARPQQSLFDAEFNLQAPFLKIQRLDRQQRIESLSAAGRAHVDEAGAVIDLDRLSSAAPSLQLSATARIVNPIANRIASGSESEQDGRPARARAQVRAKIDHAAIEQHRDAVFALAGDISGVARAADVIRAGSLKQVSLETGPPALLSELLEPRRWQASGRVENARLQLPGIDLPLQAASGDLRLADGTLFGQQLTASTQGALAADGQLALDLLTGSRRFELSATVDADLEQVLKRVRQWTDSAQLDKLSALRGRARGRLELGHRLDDLDINVRDARIMHAEGRYQGLPHPLEIRSAAVTVADRAVALDDAHLVMGKNQVKGLAGKWSWQGATNFQARLQNAEIVAQEALPWLKRIPALAPHLVSTRARGNFRLGPSRISLSPAGDLQMAASGDVNRIIVEDHRLPSAADVKNAHLTIQVSRQRLTIDFSEALIAILKSDLVLTGQVQSLFNELAGIHLNMTGSLSADLANWMRSRLGWPSIRTERAPMRITGSQLRWDAGSGGRAKADVQYGDGPALSLDLHWQTGLIEVKQLAISDEISNVHISGRSQGEELSFRFQGNLQGTTMARIFPALRPYAAGRLIGELQARLSLEHPQEASLKGYLHARDLALPNIERHAIVLTDVAISADQTAATIFPGKITLDDQPLELSGRVEARQSNFAVDLFLRADTLSWPRNQPPGNPRDHEQALPRTEGKQPMVQGRVRFDVGRFLIEPYTVSPLRGHLLLQDDGLSIELADTRLCGIALPGTLQRRSKGQMDIALKVSAEDLLLFDMLECLLQKRTQASGTFNLNAELTSQGRLDELVANLNGPVSFTASRGAVIKAPVLAKVFSYLNVTEIFAGQLPDLETRELAYDELTVDGAINGGLLQVQVVHFNGPSVEIGGYGSLDLATRQLDMIFSVAPMKTVDRIIKKLPVIGTILGGNLLAIPVRAQGHINDPKVTPLDPTAVGENLLKMMERTFQMPVQWLTPETNNNHSVSGPDRQPANRPDRTNGSNAQDIN